MTAVASRQQLVERIWSRDATVWTGAGEEKWLGWLDESKRMQERVGELNEFAEAAHQLFEDLRNAGIDYDDVVDTLEREGVEKFAKSFRELFSDLESKRDALVAA